ncbi:MAG: hypothetical protein ACK5H2_08520 [Beutenbergiaceae bacterium]
MATSPSPPAATPRTATQLLLARGGDPFDTAREQVSSAVVSVEQVIGFLPAAQHNLRERFTMLARHLQAALPLIPTERLDPSQLHAIANTAANPMLPQLHEAAVTAGTPAGSSPAVPGGEAIYGFGAAFGGVSQYLNDSYEALRNGIHSWGPHRLIQTAALAHAAHLVDQLAVGYVAAIWDFERPAMPGVPSVTGRVDLRTGPRAAPMTRWARQARVTFLSDRVEFVTASGRQVVGTELPIAFLMHVLPGAPGSVVQPYDPAERYAPLPGYDELGLVHFCDAQGYSMAAIAVADWIAQPEVMLAQAAAKGPNPALRGFDRAIYALQAAGITDGAATLRVPIRRGMQHPPSATQTGPTWLFQPGSYAAEAQPPPVAVKPIRPAPHLLPYRGWAANPVRALRRRQRRKNWHGIDLGPGNPVTEVLRAAYPSLLWIGVLGSSYLTDVWWMHALAIVAAITVTEPWLTWAFWWFTDRDKRRMSSSYRPGIVAGTNYGFQLRARLLFDGSDIGVHSGRGFEAWVGGPGDPSRGVVAIHRLMHQGQAWGFALVDQVGHWRLVLPAHDWAKPEDLSGLAGFAAAAQLRLDDEQAAPVNLDNDLLAAQSRASRTRSTGPPTTGMVRVGVHALVAVIVTLPGGWYGTGYAAAIAAVALLPVAVRAVWRRWTNSH